MIAEVYDALIEAGASERKSRAAAEALSAYENRFAAIDHRLDALEARLDLRFAELERSLDKRFADLESRWERKFADMSARMDRLEARMTFQQWQLGLLMAGVASIIIKTFFGGH